MRDDTIYLTDLGEFTNRPIIDFIYYWITIYNSRTKYLLDEYFDDSFSHEFKMAASDLVALNDVYEANNLDIEDRDNADFVRILEDLNGIREMVAELETRLSTVT